MTASSIAERVAKRVRSRRTDLGLTGKELAVRSGLSRRFLSEVEAGRANISIGRLEDVAVALETTVETLVARSSSGPLADLERLVEGRGEEELDRALALLELLFGRSRARTIALLGVRGAGKSTVGPRLADALELPFVELDERIEDAAGLELAEIFALHGEPYYRRLEARCLVELLSSGSRAAVVALPGGIVSNDEAFSAARSACTCVWLEASPDDLMTRVLAQGDRRPMANRLDAMAELRMLVASREPRYRQADIVVDTSANAPDAVTGQILTKLERSSFHIVD